MTIVWRTDISTTAFSANTSMGEYWTDKPLQHIEVITILKKKKKTSPLRKKSMKCLYSECLDKKTKIMLSYTHSYKLLKTCC